MTHTLPGVWFKVEYFRPFTLIKIVIVVLLIGVVLSLMSGLVFLFKDTDRNDSKRTLYALGLRITLAVALISTIFYGLYTGQLRMGTNAPWHTEGRHDTGFKTNNSAGNNADALNDAGDQAPAAADDSAGRQP